MTMMNSVVGRGGHRDEQATIAAGPFVQRAPQEQQQQQQQQQQPPPRRRRRQQQQQAILAAVLAAQQQQQRQQAPPLVAAGLAALLADDPPRPQPQQAQPQARHHAAAGDGIISNNNDNTDDLNRQRMSSLLQDTTTTTTAAAASAAGPSPPPPPPPTINDPNMKLTGEEEEFALQIKEIIELEPGMEPLSDYWYAHLALVNMDNIDAAVQQAHGLQAFREEYDIIETVPMGRRCVEQFLDDQPDYLMFLGNHPGEIPMLAWDYSKVISGHLSSYETLRGYYYLKHAICADFAMIRHGMSPMMECQDFDARNFGWSDYRKYFEKLGSWYPLNLHQVRLFHSGVLINCIFSMGRRFLSPEDRNKIELGISPMGNISNIYLLPTPQAARERIIERVVSGLLRRYANEAAFTLEY